MYNLQGKTALVTGAGGERGIGRAVATRLAREGADVIVSDRVANPYPGDSPDWKGLPSVVGEIEAAGRGAEAILADVSRADQVESLVSGGIDRFGRIDILVNCAGSLPGKDRVLVVDMEEEAWDKEMNVNARGVFLMCRAAARHMIERGKGGKIINIASTSGRIGRKRFSAYCASKAAIIRFTQALALELGPHGINVNSVSPTAVDTERVGFIAEAVSDGAVQAESWKDSEAHREFIQEKTAISPLGRVARAEDVAQTVAFLASPESDYLTAVDLVVSGGAEIF